MALFNHLARFYDVLFPVNPHTLAFFHHIFSERSVQCVADIACGSGKYTLAFGDMGLTAYGLDLDPAMIKAAEGSRLERNLNNVQFQVGDMRDLSSHYSGLDALICIGNSLANLTDLQDIRNTITAFYTALKPGGTAVLQLVNFDRYFHEGLHFIDIKKKEPPVKFQRSYEDTDGGLIRFKTILSFPNPDHVQDMCTEEDETLLYPLTRDIMSGLLQSSGFTDIQTRGGFDDTDLSLASPAAVYVARKPDL